MEILLPDGAAERRFDRAVGQPLEGYTALNQFRLENIVEAFEAVLVLRGEDDCLFGFDFDVAFASLEIEAVMDLFKGLVDGVFHFGEFDAWK